MTLDRVGRLGVVGDVSRISRRLDVDMVTISSSEAWQDGATGSPVRPYFIQTR